MLRLIPFFLLSLISAFAGEARGEERVASGYALSDSETDHWAKDELDAIAQLVATLPKSLRELPSKSRPGKIRVYKTSRVKTAPRHSAPPLLYWQLFVSTDSLKKAPRAEYLTELKREFMHQILHVHDSYYDLSESKGWRKHSGWRPREYLGIKLPGFPREADNQDPRGYATEQGLNDAEEDFATFGSVYFVTPDSSIEDSIACRTPGKFSFFREAFADYVPYLDQPHIKCRPVDDGFLDDIQFFDPITRQPLAMGKINADTVTGFELLYATPGVADAAEVAGHLILRMRLANNPDAEALGVENPNDLVLSFLADTEAGLPERQPSANPAPLPKQCNRPFFDLGQGRGDLQDYDAMRSITQALKGLSGGFLTTFDRQTLYQAVKSYTIDQDRNLFRYRLILTDEQKARLIEKFYLAKKSYKTKYYFFDRNCASILVQLIGEGIGDEEIASFDPLVVPPNALVALMIRKGLAEEIHPAFHSYRKKGHFAQEELNRRVARLAKAHTSHHWPSPGAFSRKAEGTRLDGYKKLAKIAAADPALRGEVFELGLLGQEAEMGFMDHTQRCEEYTTKPTAAIREMLRDLLKAEPSLARTANLDINRMLEESIGDQARHDGTLGSGHTNLSSVRIGVGRVETPESAVNVATVGFAIHRQDLGSPSRLSMQRATFVSLGEVEAAYSNRVESWRVTGLSIRKFKERLDQVPPFFTDAGTFGLGLTVLDVRGTRDGTTRGVLAGGELAANLWSSRLYERFIYVSAGGAIEGEAGGRFHLGLPLRTEGLWTFDGQRTWQARGVHQVTFRPEAGLIGKSTLSELSLAYRLGEPRGTEFLLRASASILDERRLYQLGLEWNRW